LEGLEVGLVVVGFERVENLVSGVHLRCLDELVGEQGVGVAVRAKQDVVADHLGLVTADHYVALSEKLLGLLELDVADAEEASCSGLLIFVQC